MRRFPSDFPWSWRSAKARTSFAFDPVFSSCLFDSLPLHVARGICATTGQWTDMVHDVPRPSIGMSGPDFEAMLRCVAAPDTPFVITRASRAERQQGKDDSQNPHSVSSSILGRHSAGRDRTTSCISTQLAGRSIRAAKSRVCAPTRRSSNRNMAIGRTRVNPASFLNACGRSCFRELASRR